MDLGGDDLVEGAGVGDRGGGVGKLETEQRRGRVWRAWYLNLRISPRMGLFDVFGPPLFFESYSDQRFVLFIDLSRWIV